MSRSISHFELSKSYLLEHARGVRNQSYWLFVHSLPPLGTILSICNDWASVLHVELICGLFHFSASFSRSSYFYIGFASFIFECQLFSRWRHLFKVFKTLSSWFMPFLDMELSHDRSSLWKMIRFPSTHRRFASQWYDMLLAERSLSLYSGRMVIGSCGFMATLNM